MIRYQLRCARGHAFEGWFNNSADYDAQQADGLLTCPECGEADVGKAVMAPSVRRADKREAIAAAIRSEIADNCQDVGENFATEARAMFYGEKPARGIYGQATVKEAKAMADEGIPALPIPPALDPKRAAKKLN